MNTALHHDPTSDLGDQHRGQPSAESINESFKNRALRMPKCGVVRVLAKCSYGLNVLGVAVPTLALVRPSSFYYLAL